MSRPSDPPAVRAVVFDLDGLMFNTEDLFNITGHEVLRRRGLLLTDELLSRMMGRRAHEAFAAMVEMHGLQESVEELITESWGIFSALLSAQLAPMPGLFELLEHIEQRELPKGVATSSPRAYLEDILSRFDLLPRFHTTLTAEDVTHGKPHPEIYLAAAERLGVHPHEMMVLEDSEAGTRAASAAGAIAVSVPNRHSRPHDFSAATHIVERLDDPLVLRLLGG
jgi:HAD superfamily hydrolase (TIGR01509 family)